MRRFCVVCGLVLVGIGAVAFLGLKTPAADRMLAGFVREAADRSGAAVSFERFDFDPWGPSLHLQQVRLVTADGGSFEAEHLAARFHPLASLSGTLTFDLEADRPRWAGRVGRPGGGGRVPSLAIENCTITGGSLEIALPAHQLEVSLDGIEVAWRHRKGTAGIVGGRISWRGASERLQEVSFAGEQRFGAVEVEKLEVATDRLRVEAHGRAGPWGALDVQTNLDVVAEVLPVAWARALGLVEHQPVGGRVHVAGQLRGTLDQPEWTGHLEATAVRFGGVGPASASATLSATPGRLQYENLTLDGPVVAVRGVSGALSWGDGLQLVADGRCNRFDLRPFMGLILDGWFPVGVRASGTFHAEGPLNPLSLSCRVDLDASNLDVTLEEGARPVYALGAAHVVSNLEVGSRKIGFGTTTVTTGTTRVGIPSGRIEYRRGLWFDTEVETRDLAASGGYVPPGWAVSGTASGRFGGPYRNLTFHYDLDLPKVRYDGVELGHLTGHGDYDLTTLQVTDGLLTGPAGTVEIDGQVDLVPGGRWDLAVGSDAVDLTTVVDGLGALGVEGVPDVRGRVAARGRVEGPLTTPAFAGMFTVPELDVGGHRVEGLEGRGRFSLVGWDVSKLVGKVWGGSFIAEGKGDREGLLASARLDGWVPARVAQEWGVSAPLDGVVEGRVEVRGAYAQPTARFDGMWAGAGWKGLRPGNAKVELTYRDNEVTGDVTTVTGTLGMKTVVDTRATGGYRATFDARRFDLGAFDAWVPDGVEPGTLTGTGAIEGRWSRPGLFTAQATATIEGGGWPDRPLGPVEIGLDRKGKGLEVTLVAGGGAARLDALLSRQPATPVQFEVVLDDAHLSRLAPAGVVAGTVTGRIEGVLGLDDLLEASDPDRRLAAVSDLSGDVRWAGLEMQGSWPVPDGSVHLDRRGRQLRGTAQLPGLDLEGVWTPSDRRWALTGTLAGFEPARWFPPGHPGSGAEGRWDGSFEASGVGRDVEKGVLHTRVDALSWGPLAPGDWSVDGSWDKGVLAATVARSSELSVAIGWSGGRGWSLTGEVDRAHPERWLRAGLAPADLQTELTGRVEVRMPPGVEPEVDVRFSRVWASLPPVELENRGDVRVRYLDGRLTADAVAFDGEGLSLDVKGTAGPREGWNLGLTGTCHLQVLPRWFGEVSRASGVLKGDVRVAGPWKAPHLEGPVQLESGTRVSLGALSMPFEDADASLRFEKGKATLEWFDAQFGEGRVHLEGVADLGAGGKPGDLRFFAELRDIAYEAPPQVSYTADADFLVTGTVTSPQVRGDVRLERFRFARRISLTNLILEALRKRARSAPADYSGDGGVYVDVAVRGDRGLRVENNLVSLPLTVDLRARGFLPAPELWGRVGIQEGSARFRNLDYTIARSSVEFLGDASPVPLVDFHARTETGGYRVNLEATGPLDDYQVMLTSAPPLSQTDIVALLTLGSTTDALATGEGVGQVEAASLLTGGLVESVGGGLSSVFGIDQFQIDPVYSPTAQSTVPRVTLGRPLTRDLYTRYSVAVGSEYEQDLEVQYSWTRNLSFLGTWSDRGTKGTGREGSLGGEVRLRFGFR